MAERSAIPLKISPFLAIHPAVSARAKSILARHHHHLHQALWINTHMEKGYDRVVAVSTSLLQDVTSPTDQVPFLVVPHTQCPRPAVAPLFSHPNRHQHVTTTGGNREVSGATAAMLSGGTGRWGGRRRVLLVVVVVVGGFGGHGAFHAWHHVKEIYNDRDIVQGNKSKITCCPLLLSPL